jgi:hypothetical protein
MLLLIGLLAGSAISAAAMAGPPEEEHFDVLLRLSSEGRIVTGAATEDEQLLRANERVFGAEFGGDPMFPFLATEPGFQTLLSSFSSLTSLTFNIEDEIGRWNGGGFDFGLDESMTLSFEGSSVDSAGGFVSGFDIMTDAGGYLHDHFFMNLNGAGRSDPLDGVYLMPLSFEITGNASSRSLPFWFVLNLNMSEEDHEAAIDWVTAELAPAPGGLALLGLAFMGGVRRRRA